MAVGLTRGDVLRLRPPRRSGHEQRGIRFGVVVQNDALELSTVLVAPTSRCARATRHRPAITVGGESTCVLVEQLAAVDVGRVGELVDRLEGEELIEVARALELVLGLR